ncbi:MAG: Uma2 family endonuclease [Cyanobacteria bacterium P01_E01_bin.48]
MTVSVPIRMTLAEYLNYDGGTDTRYELVDGELVVMPPESELNQRIASLLFALFLKRGIPFDLINIGVEIVTSGSRATTRVPDLAIFTEELMAAYRGASRATITLDMPPPKIVVEVVSPGPENRDRDYRYKRSEYAARSIAEYWIVDPQQQKVTVLELVSGFYEEKIFSGSEMLVSPSFDQLSLTAEKLLRAEM